MSDELSFYNNPIVIDTWQRDDTYEGVYLPGTREKDAYFSPSEPKYECIKPNWRYLFKLSRTTSTKFEFSWQFWCEIIAYRFGSLIGVKVPPSHIGLSKTYRDGIDTYAALIEWFYDDRDKGYIAGGQLMESHIKNFDRLKGEKHNFETIIGMFKHDSWLKYWAGVLTFDVLIGNTDRHQDNWGLIVKRTKRGNEMLIDINTSPAFDNGTALCYEILEQDIGKYEDTNKLERYLTGRYAKHHMKWSLDENEQLDFYKFMKKFSMAFPNIIPIIAQHLNFTYQNVEEVLAPLVEAVSNPVYKLTKERLDFILKLIFRRKRILEEVLEL